MAALDLIRLVISHAKGRGGTVVTKRNVLQAKILKALGVDTAAWDPAAIATSG